MKVLEIAKHIVFERGRTKVWMEDWYCALRVWRSGKSEGKKS